jgi:hypothetical protein
MVLLMCIPTTEYCTEPARTAGGGSAEMTERRYPVAVIRGDGTTQGGPDAVGAAVAGLMRGAGAEPRVGT